MVCFTRKAVAHCDGDGCRESRTYETDEAGLSDREFAVRAAGAFANGGWLLGPRQNTPAYCPACKVKAKLSTNKGP